MLNSKIICALLAAISAMAQASSESRQLVKEVVSGSIYRKEDSISVDTYTLFVPWSVYSEPEGKLDVEFDLLSAEEQGKLTFTDVNEDCDSSYIDTQIYLMRKGANDELILVDWNDDVDLEETENGGADGSVSGLDSYLSVSLEPGVYKLAVGRYPMSFEEAKAEVVSTLPDTRSPYACNGLHAPYGNYRLTVNSKWTASVLEMTAGDSDFRGLLTSYPNTYVGASCDRLTYDDDDCMYPMYPSAENALLHICPYDFTFPLKK